MNLKSLFISQKYNFNEYFTVFPMSLVVGIISTPAEERALTFSDALADFPVIIAPACPIRLPLGALAPTIKPKMGL